MITTRHPVRPPTRDLRFHDCLERGMETRRRPAMPLRGRAIRAVSGLEASFSADVRRHRMRALRFECSTCVTLVAYCQGVVDLLEGEAAGTSAVPALDELVACVRGVPATMQDRAAIALGAYRALITTISSEKEEVE